jgi:hypothetical protein
MTAMMMVRGQRRNALPVLLLRARWCPRTTWPFFLHRTHSLQTTLQVGIQYPRWIECVLNDGKCPCGWHVCIPYPLEVVEATLNEKSMYIIHKQHHLNKWGGRANDQQSQQVRELTASDDRRRGKGEDKKNVTHVVPTGSHSIDLGYMSPVFQSVCAWLRLSR